MRFREWSHPLSWLSLEVEEHRTLRDNGMCCMSTKKKKINRVQQNNFKRYLSFGMNGVKLY